MEKWRKSLVMAILLIVLFPVVTKAGVVPDSIRIGLETVYKDAQRIELGAAASFTVGYQVGNTLIGEGTLPTNRLIVTPISGAEGYYSDGSTYDTLQTAMQIAQQLGGDTFPAYILPGKYCVYTTDSSSGWARVSLPSSAIKVANTSGQVLLLSHNSDMPLVFQGDSLAYGVPTTQVGTSRSYRGAIEIVKGQYSGLTPVNVIDFESYLYGVIPNEMPALWPIEALKAQSVAARSMATFQYNRYVSRGYNLVDSTLSQVYKGVSSEHSRTNEAVEATRGEVITYNGSVAEALYFSTSGGYTENAKYVWGNEVAYLQAVPDLFETEPEQKPWTRTITLAELDACLQKAGSNIGSAKGVSIKERTPSGRVLKLEIIGTTGNYVLTNENVRTFFSATTGGSLKSRMFSLGNSSSDVTTPTEAGIHILSSNGMEIKSPAGLTGLTATTQGTITSPVFVQGAVNSTIYTADTLQPGTSQVNETMYGDLTISGQGYGHGVGMSQSGARGMATAGMDYETILQHYYTGVRISR